MSNAARPDIVRASGAGVADRWKAQYCRKGAWDRNYQGDSKDVWEKLVALGCNPSPARVAEVIGNKSWTHIRCSACWRDVLTAVSWGPEAEDYGPIKLCRPCTIRAVKALDRVMANSGGNSVKAVNPINSPKRRFLRILNSALD